MADRAMRALREVAATSATNFLLPVSAIVTAPLIARSLGSAGRGEYAALTSPVLLIGVLGTLGLQDFSTQLLASRGFKLPDVRHVLTRCAGWLLVWNAVLFVVFSTLVVAGGSNVWLVVTFFACSIPTSVGTSLLHGIAVGRGLFMIVRMNRTLTALLRIGAIAGAYALGVLDLVSALALFAAIQFVVFVAMTQRLARRTTEERAALPAFERQLAGRDIWCGALTLLAGSGFSVCLARFDQSIAYLLVGSSELGYYAVAVAVFEVPTAIIFAIRTYITGSQDFLDAPRSLMLKSLALSAVAGMVVGGVGFASASLVVPLLFGPDFLGAVAPTQLMMLGVPFALVLATSASLLVRARRNVAQAICYGTALLVNVLLLFAIGPTLGAIGLAVASAAALVIGSVIAVAFVLVRVSRSEDDVPASPGRGERCV